MIYTFSDYKIRYAPSLCKIISEAGRLGFIQFWCIREAGNFFKVGFFDEMDHWTFDGGKWVKGVKPHGENETSRDRLERTDP